MTKDFAPVRRALARDKRADPQFRARPITSDRADDVGRICKSGIGPACRRVDCRGPAGIPSVPATVFPPKLHELWADVRALPTVDDGPPPEIPIWDDTDVRSISMRDEAGAHRGYSVDMLTPSDRSPTFSIALSRCSNQARQIQSQLRVCVQGVIDIRESIAARSCRMAETRGLHRLRPGL